MNFKVLFYHKSDEWHLSKRGDSTLLHTYHPRIVDDANQLKKDDMDSTQVYYLRIMYEQGAPHSSMADVMSEVMRQKGKKGALLAQTVRNITAKVQKAMDVLAGIDLSWSVAKKTLKVMTE